MSLLHRRRTTLALGVLAPLLRLATAGELDLFGKEACFQATLFADAVLCDRRSFAAKNLVECGRRLFERLSHDERQAWFLGDHRSQEFICAANMHDLVGKLDVEEFRQLFIPLTASIVNSESNRVDASGFEGAVLHRQAPGKGGDLADDPKLKVDHWIFADLPPALLQKSAEDESVARLVGTLTGEEHAQVPRRIRKVGQAPRRTFGRIHLLVHLPMQELLELARIPFREIRAFLPAVDHDEPRIARWAKCLRAFLGHARASCSVASVSSPCCLRSTEISSSVNSASCRSGTLIGADWAALSTETPTMLTVPGGG